MVETIQSIIPASQLVQTFKSNHWLACHLLEGITHQESLLRPPFQANPMNWVLGHILVGRDRALKALDKPRVLNEAETDLYKTGSKPITHAPVLFIEKLSTLLDETQANLELAPKQVPEEFLTEIITTRQFGDRPRWRHISGLGWHETYHVGQLEMLRQLVMDSRGENET